MYISLSAKQYSINQRGLGKLNFICLLFKMNLLLKLVSSWFLITLDFLDLELQVVINDPIWWVETKLVSSTKAKSAPNHRAISPAPRIKNVRLNRTT